MTSAIPPVMDDIESAVLRRIVICPGTSDHDIAELLGERILSPAHEDAVRMMEDRGEIEVSGDVIGYRKGGRPIKGWRCYPTADGTARILLDYIGRHPGCTEVELEGAFAPCGGVPDWLETDIERLVSEDRIAFERKGRDVPNTRSMVILREFRAVEDPGRREAE